MKTQAGMYKTNCVGYEKNYRDKKLEEVVLDREERKNFIIQPSNGLRKRNSFK